MRWFIISLIVCAPLFAQEAAFFEFPVSDDVTFATAASSGGPLIEVFYNTVDGAFHLTYDTESQIVVGPILELDQFGPVPRVMTAEILANGDWACVVTTCEACDTYPRIHGAWIVRGEGPNIIYGDLFYEAEETPMPYDCCGALQGPRITARPDGEYSVTGVAPGSWGVESTAELVLFPYVNEFYPVGDHVMMVFPQYFGNDTLEILSASSFGGLHHQRVAVDCEFDCAPAVSFWPVSSFPSLLLMTPGRQVLALWNEYLFAMQPDSTRDTVAVLEQELGWSEPVADVHPEYGFAYLTQYSHGHILHRVDTLGASPALSGNVAWDAIPNSASINFSSDGDLLVAYALDENRIGLAIVPWDAPLDYPVAPPFLPADYKLSVYPNPFNSVVSIHYELPLPGVVRVSVFNTLGQEMSTLHDGPVNAGWHTLKWSPNAASGIYFVKFASGDFVTSRKILYVR